MLDGKKEVAFSDAEPFVWLTASGNARVCDVLCQLGTKKWRKIPQGAIMLYLNENR
jgi:hypothetical protein